MHLKKRLTKEGPKADDMQHISSSALIAHDIYYFFGVRESPSSI